MRFKITLGGASLAFTRLIDDSRPDSLDYYMNRSYHCPQCGAMWATWEIEDQKAVWYPFRRSCPSHETGAWYGDRPGSLILYPSDVAVASRALLEHETLRRISDIENYGLTQMNKELS